LGNQWVGRQHPRKIIQASDKNNARPAWIWLAPLPEVSGGVPSKCSFAVRSRIALCGINPMPCQDEGSARQNQATTEELCSPPEEKGRLEQKTRQNSSGARKKRRQTEN
jgi:hypothetical protein